VDSPPPRLARNCNKGIRVAWRMLNSIVSRRAGKSSLRSALVHGSQSAMSCATGCICSAA